MLCRYDSSYDPCAAAEDTSASDNQLGPKVAERSREQSMQVTKQQVFIPSSTCNLF